jgi:hypothetical protein
MSSTYSASTLISWKVTSSSTNVFSTSFGTLRQTEYTSQYARSIDEFDAEGHGGALCFPPSNFDKSTSSATGCKLYYTIYPHGEPHHGDCGTDVAIPYKCTAHKVLPYVKPDDQYAQHDPILSPLDNRPCSDNSSQQYRLPTEARVQGHTSRLSQRHGLPLARTISLVSVDRATVQRQLLFLPSRHLLGSCRKQLSNLGREKKDLRSEGKGRGETPLVEKSLDRSVVYFCARRCPFGINPIFWVAQ